MVNSFQSVWPDQIEDRARKALQADSRFRGRDRSIRMENREGVLVLTGRVPSFYLKQVLQSVLARVDGVIQIENRVDVIAVDGLSSTASRLKSGSRLHSSVAECRCEAV